MNENDLSSSLSEAMKKIMSTPEISDIISSLSSDTQNEEQQDATDDSGSDTPEKASAMGGISIPPELLAKLPSMLSALTATAPSDPSASSVSASDDGSESAAVTSGKDKKSADARRKALLSSLRPYLNSHRQSVIDDLLRIEKLSGLISSIGPIGKIL